MASLSDFANQYLNADFGTQSAAYVRIMEEERRRIEQAEYYRRRQREGYSDYERMVFEPWGEPDTTNGIDKKKVFEGKPGSVLPVEIMKDLSRVNGKELKSRVAMFV